MIYMDEFIPSGLFVNEIRADPCPQQSSKRHAKHDESLGIGSLELDVEDRDDGVELNCANVEDRIAKIK